MRPTAHYHITIKSQYYVVKTIIHTCVLLDD